MDQNKVKSLQTIATRMRKHVLTQVYSASSGHPGGSLGICDVLSLLYFHVMDIPDPKDPNRDRFVLSKGHCAPALYAALAEKAYFPVSELNGFRSIDSFLEGHPDMKYTPGVDMSTGSLGLGISAANGMALAAKLDNKPYRVFAVLGDGELQEGQVWEAAMFAAHYKLDNLTAFIDNNGLQIDGDISKVMSPLPIDQKFQAFGWHVVVCDGHDFNALEQAINDRCQGKPTAVIMKTTKGKGVSFMENQAGWHGTAPNKEQYEEAISQLDCFLKNLECREEV